VDGDLEDRTVYKGQNLTQFKDEYLKEKQLQDTKYLHVKFAGDAIAGPTTFEELGLEEHARLNGHLVDILSNQTVAELVVGIMEPNHGHEFRLHSLQDLCSRAETKFPSDNWEGYEASLPVFEYILQLLKGEEPAVEDGVTPEVREGLKTVAFEALWYLTRDSAWALKSATCEDCVKTLCSVVRDATPGTPVRASSSACLANLAFHGHKDVIVKMGIGSDLVQMLIDGSIQGKISACGLIGNLCPGSPSFLEQVLKADVLDTMAALLGKKIKGVDPSAVPEKLKCKAARGLQFLVKNALKLPETKDLVLTKIRHGSAMNILRTKYENARNGKAPDCDDPEETQRQIEVAYSEMYHAC